MRLHVPHRPWCVRPTMKEVMSHYGGDKLQFIMHRFPLPYHHNSYFANWAAGAVASLDAQGGGLGKGAVWPVLGIFCKNTFSGAKTRCVATPGCSFLRSSAVDP